jgi:hypothetical protein
VVQQDHGAVRRDHGRGLTLSGGPHLQAGTTCSRDSTLTEPHLLLGESLAVRLVSDGWTASGPAGDSDQFLNARTATGRRGQKWKFTSRSEGQARREAVGTEGWVGVTQSNGGLIASAPWLFNGHHHLHLYPRTRLRSFQAPHAYALAA